MQSFPKKTGQRWNFITIFFLANFLIDINFVHYNVFQAGTAISLRNVSTLLSTIIEFLDIIHRPIDRFWCPDIWNSSIDWAQMSRLSS
jgi:hypothetical protein